MGAVRFWLRVSVTGFEGLVDPEVLGEDEGSEVAEAMKAREALLLVLEAVWVVVALRHSDPRRNVTTATTERSWLNFVRDSDLRRNLTTTVMEYRLSCAGCPLSTRSRATQFLFGVFVTTAVSKWHRDQLSL